MKNFIKEKTTLALAAITLASAFPFSAFAGEAEVKGFNEEATKLPKAESFLIKDYHQNKEILKAVKEAYAKLEESDKASLDKEAEKNFEALKAKEEAFIKEDKDALSKLDEAVAKLPKEVNKDNLKETEDKLNEIHQVISLMDKSLRDNISEATTKAIAKAEEKVEACKQSIADNIKNENLKALNKALDAYEKEVKFVNGINKMKVTLSTPEVPAGYSVDISVNVNGSLMQEVKNIKTAKNIEVGFLQGAKYKVEITMTKGDIKSSITKDLKAPEVTAPSLAYAYVFDGGLVINVKASAGVKDIFWAYKGERYFSKLSSDAGYGRYYRGNSSRDKNDFSDFFKKVAPLDRYTRLDKDDYRINVKIPSTVNILVEDNMGNKTPMTIKVEKDNTALTKTVPSNVVDALKDVTNFTYRNRDEYKDLLIVDKNTVVDLFEVFESHIVKKLGNFNTRDLTWKSEQLSDSIPYTGVYKFDKEGTFQIQVKDTNGGKTADMTVIVNSGANNVRSYELIKKEIEVEKDKFKPMDALKLNLYDNEKANPISFIAIVNGKYVKLTDEVAFKDKDGKDVDKLMVKIVNLKEDKTYEVTFVKKAVQKDFPDIKGHWAEKMITSLAERGVIKGYTDGKFKPNNKITIRETLLILGRYGQRNEKLCGNKVSDFELISKKTKDDKINWGYDEIKFAMDRLPSNIFAGKNEEALTNTAITREEVAYIMKHLYNVSESSTKAPFTDIENSKYLSEINSLTSSNIIRGYLDHTFKPGLEITRAELSSLLFNLPNSFK